MIVAMRKAMVISTLVPLGCAFAQVGGPLALSSNETNLQSSHALQTMQGVPSAQTGSEASSAPGWRLAPTGQVTRTYPRLVNYHHMALPDGQVDQKEARLAQWDIVIVNPDTLVAEGLSLDRLRQTNPRVKLLAWIPFGQELQGMAIAQGIPPEGTNDWFCRYANGQYIRPPWGGHFMNPYAANFAWPR
jgi:hypothetical protein